MNASPHAVRAVAGVLLVWSLLSPAVQAQTLTRGPYLQNENPTAISIRWRTSANAAFARRIAGAYPEAARDWAATIVTPEQRLRVMEGLAQR